MTSFGRRRSSSGSVDAALPDIVHGSKMREKCGKKIKSVELVEFHNNVAAGSLLLLSLHHGVGFPYLSSFQRSLPGKNRASTQSLAVLD